MVVDVVMHSGLRIHLLDYVAMTSSRAFKRVSCWHSAELCALQMLQSSHIIIYIVRVCHLVWIQDLWMLDMFCGVGGLHHSFRA